EARREVVQPRDGDAGEAADDPIDAALDEQVSAFAGAEGRGTRVVVELDNAIVVIATAGDAGGLSALLRCPAGLRPAADDGAVNVVARRRFVGEGLVDVHEAVA